MKKILVTGGAGYIGSACTEYLLDLGYQVTVFDALITGHRDAVDPRAEFIEGHLGDRQLILDVCRKGEFDAIMHFAAFSLVGESMKDPGKYFGNNLACGINLADAAIAENNSSIFCNEHLRMDYSLPSKTSPGSRSSVV